MIVPELDPMTQAVLLLAALALSAAHASGQPAGMVRIQDTDTGVAIEYPAGWRVEQPGGTTPLVFSRRDPDRMLLCSVERTPDARLAAFTQKLLDEQLVTRFRTRDWPEQLAAGRSVVDFQVRSIGGAPMGAIAWESLEERPDRLFSEGLKVFRMTPGTLWSAECVAVAPGKTAASAHFAEHSDLLGEILRSVRFPAR